MANPQRTLETIFEVAQLPYDEVKGIAYGIEQNAAELEAGKIAMKDLVRFCSAAPTSTETNDAAAEHLQLQCLHEAGLWLFLDQRGLLDSYYERQMAADSWNFTIDMPLPDSYLEFKEQFVDHALRQIVTYRNPRRFAGIPGL